MSRTLVRPAPDVARAVGAVLFLGIAALHFLALPQGFLIEAWVGVSLVLAFLMALFGTVGLLVENTARVWWYALVEGVLNMGGWFLTRVNDLPVTPTYDTRGGWMRSHGLLLFFCGTCLATLSVWMLRLRHLDKHEPLASARDRLLHR
ncbi:hypothetical protein GCM10027589_09740 [Actinocorallia lasiicapitis]